VDVEVDVIEDDGVAELFAERLDADKGQDR
jgi:hypothetical protein